MNITKQGDIEIKHSREILPTREDFFLVEFSCACLGATDMVPMLCGDRAISIKFWKDGEGNGKPTIVSTGLKWKTFDMDDNILIMVKKSGMPMLQTITILITKKYQG